PRRQRQPRKQRWLRMNKPPSGAGQHLRSQQSSRSFLLFRQSQRKRCWSPTSASIVLTILPSSR
ncbi:unnamed protein product, partial [Symbiodinium pilosum]